MNNSEKNTNLEQQMFHELASWQRTLNYIQQENIHLKNRVSEIIKNGMDDRLLEKVEFFQNQFLNKDAIIVLLKQDISSERDLDGGLPNKRNWKKHDNLRKDMGMMEAEFNKLKFDFNNYLSQSL